MIQPAAKVIHHFFDIGRLLDIKPIPHGTVNQGFIVRTTQNGHIFKFYLRRYHPSRKEREIKFEHAYLQHLKASGFEPAAGTIVNREGATYVKSGFQSTGSAPVALWALFEFLAGDDRDPWPDTPLPLDEMMSAAKTLCRLHSASLYFHKPLDAESRQPGISPLLSTLRKTYDRYARQSGTGRFDNLFRRYHATILTTVDTTQADLQTLPNILHLPIHGDYHPGNLKFKDGKVTGVFDFDWCKKDTRLFDLALALIYFCSCWEESASDRLDIDRYGLFLSVYQQTALDQPQPVPLDTVENKHLPIMLIAANQFVIHWIVSSFYSDDTMATEHFDNNMYLKCLRNSLQLMEWLNTHRDRLKTITEKNEYRRKMDVAPKTI